jgi:chromosome segregation ATPase
MSASDPRWRWPGLLALLLCCAALAPAFGQQASREQEQVRRLRLQVQRLQQDLASERAAVQQAKAEAATTAATRDAAATERDAAQGQLRKAQSAIASESQRNTALEQQLAAAQEQATTLATQLAQSQVQLRASTEQVTRLRDDGVAFQRRLVAQESSFADLQARHVRQAEGMQICIARNRSLRDVGLDLLQRYASKTVADVLAQDEPFLQFQRVKLENLLQDYEGKLDQLAVKPAAPGTAQAAPDGPASARRPARAP